MAAFKMRIGLIEVGLEALLLILKFWRKRGKTILLRHLMTTLGS